MDLRNVYQSESTLEVIDFRMAQEDLTQTYKTITSTYSQENPLDAYVIIHCDLLPKFLEGENRRN